MTRRFHAGLLIPIVLYLLLSSPVAARRGPRAGDRTTVAPSFTLPGRAGAVCLDSLRGRVVYVDFWASWCDPCRRSFPWMRDLNDRYSAKGLTIVAINLDKDRAAADAFLEDHPAPFVVAFDSSGSTAEAYKVSAMPSSFLVGPTGALLHSHTGFSSKETRTIEALIQEVCPR